MVWSNCHFVDRYIYSLHFRPSLLVNFNMIVGDKKFWCSFQDFGSHHIYILCFRYSGHFIWWTIGEKYWYWHELSEELFYLLLNILFLKKLMLLHSNHAHSFSHTLPFYQNILISRWKKEKEETWLLCKILARREIYLALADGVLTAVQTLASTSICGIIHSIVGGQPLLILGVAEPTVIMYTFMFNFAKERADLGRDLFLAWTGWWAD